MADKAQAGLVKAVDAARSADIRRAANGLNFATVGDTQIADADLDRLVQAVPAGIAGALTGKTYYFVPLAMPEPRAEGLRAEGLRLASDTTLIAPVFTAELADEAICHRAVEVPAEPGRSAHEGIFISARLLNDRFALAFELFINVGHAFVEAAGVPQEFQDLAWAQATADIRGETSQDAWESRTAAVGTQRGNEPKRIDEKARLQFFEATFADALAIYQLSLAVDFDYSELREREYPLLAPQALADRLRLVAKLFPPNAGYEFSVRYRRRA